MLTWHLLFWMIVFDTRHYEFLKNRLLRYVSDQGGVNKLLIFIFIPTSKLIAIY